MTGKEMCSLSKEEFCSRAPVFVGDILWEHLVLLQQDVDRECAALKNAPSTLSEISTEPVSLPPSPPRQPQLYPVPVSHSVSPQKTYHTLSPQRTQQTYSAPSPPVSYTTIDTSAHPVTIKSEYPSSGQQYQYQYHPYQRLAQPYQHYPYQHNPYEMAQSQSYPGYQPSPVTVPVERWSQQTASYQVKRGIISHY